MATGPQQSVAVWAVGTTLVAAAVVVGCSSQSGIERPREAAVAQDEREVRRSTVAGPPRSAPITVADRSRWQPILRWPESCEAAFRTSRASDDGGVAFHQRGPGLSTVEVLCAAGSYQPSHVFLRFDERRSSPESNVLRFPTYQSEDGVRVTHQVEAELFGETAVSPDGRELSVLNLARQLGDCGIWTRYAIGTESPKVVAAATRLPCPDTPGERVEWTDGSAPPGWQPQDLEPANP